MSDRVELDKLKKTFEEFIRASSQLEGSYERLKVESQQLSLYLSNILENMNGAVMVFDNQCALTLWNGESVNYFPALSGSRPPVSLESLTGDPAVDPALDIGGILRGGSRLTEVEVGENSERRWLEIAGSDFIDAQKKKIGYILVINDKTELKKLQIKSRQEDRLRVMGELAAEVAHEIRNPLGSIELMVTLLQEDLAGHVRHDELLNRIRSSVSSMNHTVTNILLYTREIRPDYALFPLSHWVDQSEGMVMGAVTRKAIRLEKNVPHIEMKGDLELLKQCLANILINAAQAVERGGWINVGGRYCGDEPGVVEVEISDNGGGIPPEIRGRIFDPFFTTRNTGTGLGLAMVKRVVEAHRGSISCQSGDGGTTFLIRLPVGLGLEKG